MIYLPVKLHDVAVANRPLLVWPADYGLSVPATIEISSTSDELVVPATVEIPAGVTSVSFPIIAVDNGVIEGTRTETVTTSVVGIEFDARPWDHTADIQIAEVPAAAFSTNMFGTGSDWDGDGSFDSAQLFGSRISVIPNSEIRAEYEFTTSSWSGSISAASFDLTVGSAFATIPTGGDLVVEVFGNAGNNNVATADLENLSSLLGTFTLPRGAASVGSYNVPLQAAALELLLSSGSVGLMLRLIDPQDGGYLQFDIDDGFSGASAPSLNVTGVGNAAPVIADQTFSIAENSVYPTVAGTVVASDPDGDAFSTIILSGNEAGHFFMNSGVLRVGLNVDLDYETQSSYPLVVQVTDVFGNSSTANVTINLSDVNEAPTANSASFSGSEDSDIAGAVGGSDMEGSPLTFALVSGPSNGSLTLNGDGTFSYSPNADFNGSDSFTFVSNDGSLDSASATVSLNVAAVNDAPTVDSATASLPENSANGTVVAVVSAADIDTGDIVTFDITGGNSSGAFAIDSASGEIFVTDSTLLDFETTPQFDLTVTVTDSGGLTASADVTISLTDVAEVPPTKFFVVDITSDSAFRYDADGGALATTSLNNPKSRGVAADISGTTYWVVDANKTVYVYDAESGTEIGSWQATGLSNPQGITTDGTDIWIVDNKLDKVFHFSGAASRLSGSQAADSSFAVNRKNRNARGIVTDGSSIWTVQTARKDKVFKYSMDGTLQGYWTIAGGNTSPTGIAIDPANVSNIWIVDNASDSVYQYSGAANQTSGTLTADSVFALGVGNTNPQGIADPPPSAFSRTTSAMTSTGDSNGAVQEGLESFVAASAASIDSPGRDSLLTFQSMSNAARRPDGALIETQGTTTEVANSSDADIDAERSSATDVASFSTESDAADAEAVWSLLADEAWLSYQRQ